MSDYVAVSVGKSATPGIGAGGNKVDQITIYRKEDVLTFPARDGKGVLITDDIVMKPGKYAIQIYGQLETINKGFTTEGDGDGRGFKHTTGWSHPGDELEIMEFIQNYNGVDVYIVIQKCNSNRKTLLGSPCAPLRIAVEGTDDQENNGNAFTAESIIKTNYLPAKYEGTITLEEVKSVVAAGVTTFSVANGEGEYQLTGDAGAETIATLTDAVHGGVYTLLGIVSGAVAPTVTSGNDFLLKDGATWTATGGSRLTVKAFKDGAASWKFVEQSRS